MDDDFDLLFTQMGLILTQLRFARRALEDVERSTARYGSLDFQAAFAAGPRLGDPPLMNGALKVYVVNINDLSPGSGGMGFLEALLGGVGRLFGGLFGGLIGGTISGTLLPVLLAQVESIARTIERIVTRLGLGEETPAAPSPPPQAGASPAPAASLTATLPEITRTVQALTGLFTAASSGPDAAAATTGGPPPQTVAGQSWLAVMQSIQSILAGVSHVLDGLIILLTLAIGAIALLLSHLNAIKLALVDLLEFALRNVFLLRGVTLVTIYDTLAAVAGLAANLLNIIGTLAGRVLTSIFIILGHVLSLALEALRFQLTGLSNVITGLLRWVVGTVFALLNGLGDTLIFRVIIHILRILPAVLPPLVLLVRNERVTNQEALDRAAALPFSAAPGGPPPTIPDFPAGAALLPPSRTDALLDQVQTTGRGIAGEVRNMFYASGDALRATGRALTEAAEGDGAGFNAGLSHLLGRVSERANTLSTAFSQAQRAAAAGPATGFEAIAQAYEGWLSGGGLDTILGAITQHFRNAPELPRAAVGAADVARATVEIQDVVIELTPGGGSPPVPDSGPSAPGDYPLPSGSTRVAEVWEDLFEWEERGGRRAALA